MAPKRKITVDLPNSRKSRDKNDRLDRSINDNKSREHSRNSDKDKKDRNIAADREDSNRSSERERSSNKMSSGNAGNIFPNERSAQRDRERDNKEKSGGDSTQHRASVFSRLGKGPLNAPNSTSSNTSQQKGICRPWADTGHCPYGNECRFKHISNLVSPSKRPIGPHDSREAKEKERESGSRPAGHREETGDRTDNKDRHRQLGGDRDQMRTLASSKDSSRKDSSRPGGKIPMGKHSLASKLGGKLKTDSPLIDPNWENWDEDNLDYDDELMLEKKRQLLQMELAKQMAVDGGANTDSSTIAPGSSVKGQKVGASANIQSSGKGAHQPNLNRNKNTSKKSLEEKSSSSSTSSSSSSDSGSSSGSSSSSESSEDSEGGSAGNLKKKAKAASSTRNMSSTGGGILGSKSSTNTSSAFSSSKHRDRGSRASSISSSETKRKKKDRSGRSSRISSKKSRNSIGRSKSTIGTKTASSSKRDKKRTDRKSKNSSKHSGNKREDNRGKSPLRHGKRDKRSLSSERNTIAKDSRNRRSSHSPHQSNSNKKRRSSGGHSDERPRDHKFDRERTGSARENKNSYTSATGAGGSGRDRDLRRSDLGNVQPSSISRDYTTRDDKHDNRNRDFQRGNNNFDSRGKFGRDSSVDTNKDRWNNSRNELNKGNDTRSNERTGAFDQRREGHQNERDRRPTERSIASRDSDKSRTGYNRTSPHGFKNQREEWNRSPVGDRNREGWDDGGNMWNRDRGSSPTDRRKGPRPTTGSNSNILSGANSVPVKADQVIQRRGKSPFGSRERSNRSRSRERLLPPQALNRSTGSISDHRDNNRSDRRNTHDRDRSPRVNRNIRPDDHMDRRRSPRDGSRGSLDRFTQRREQGGDSYDDRHDKDRRKEFTGNANLFARTDRSRSRETRMTDKFAEEGKVDMPQSENMTKYLDTPKTSHSISSPKRTSPSPSSHNYDKKSITESKVVTNDLQSETAGEYGSNQMGTEEYSDFDSDSGEEWLNDMRDEEKMETEETVTSNNEPENTKDMGKESCELKAADENEDTNQDEFMEEQASDNLQKRNKTDGLLEGISDEDLDDVSDEENAEKNGHSAKLADALGVDWSQLVELQQKHKKEENTDDPTKSASQDVDEKEAQARARRKYWSPIAIFNRVGIPRSFLSDTFYNGFIQQLNDNAQDGEKLELLHENAGDHVQLKEMRERRRNLFVTGPYSRPMLARQEIAIRRELCGLPKEEFCEMPCRPNTDMELWNKAVELMRGTTESDSLEEVTNSNSGSKMTQVH